MTTQSSSNIPTGILNTILQGQGVGSPSAFTTATYPPTTTINQILYSSAANAIVGLATANSSVLITSAGGVPSLAGTLPAAVQGNITAVGALASGSLAAGFTPVTVPIGGTGLNTATAFAVLCGGTVATGAFQSIASVGAAGQVLTSNGAGALPTFQPTAGGGGHLLSFQILTAGTAATYTKNVNATAILVECIGGGGGGGGSTATGASVSASGGGGGGGYCRKFITGAAATYTYTIGAGGAGGATSGNNGTAGGATTFSGAAMSAGGGSGGVACAGFTTTGVVAAMGGAGGLGTNGDINFLGGAGTWGILGNSAGANNAISGAGGSSAYGGGAQSAFIGLASGNVAGNNGTVNTGGGGSGAVGYASAASAAGGTGGSGLIIVWEFS